MTTEQAKEVLTNTNCQLEVRKKNKDGALIYYVRSLTDFEEVEGAESMQQAIAIAVEAFISGE